jgi:ABC-type oligopeptide transport system ATPase subunit
MDEDSSIHSNADHANSESREDSQETPTARDLMAAPQPLPRPTIPVKESKSLTSRALEAIAQSKKNKYRYRDELTGNERGEIAVANSSKTGGRE